jgi:hypothetical protein
MKELRQLVRSVSCFMIAVLLFGWIILRLRILDSHFDVRIPLSAETPGVLMMILGAILVSMCVVAFGFWGGGTPSLLAPTKNW